MGGCLLDAQGLNHFFGGLQAVCDLDLRVAEGQIQALIGPNGAGKSTVLNLIAGTLRPHSGAVKFRGNSITGRKPHAVAALGIARTFQTARLFPRMTVLENVQVGRHVRSHAGFLDGLLNLPRAQAEERAIRRDAEGILAELGLAEDAQTPAGNLSFGRQRMVEFGRALAMEPGLLLLDEPAAGLNIYEAAELAKFIRKIRDRGVTVVIVEHDMSLVMEISDSVVVLDHGSKLAEGAPKEIQRNPEVIRIYLGEDHA